MLFLYFRTVTTKYSSLFHCLPDLFLPYISFINRRKMVRHIDLLEYYDSIFQNSPYSCSEKLHLQSYLEMIWSKTGYFGLLGNNIKLVIILLDLIKR